MMRVPWATAGRLVLASFAILVGGIATPAGDFDAGLEAYRAGDFAAALESWLPLAEQGMIEAQYNVGMLHYHGQAGEVDRAEAAKWYRLAADQGYVRAQYELAVMYEAGDGVDADPVQAFAWFRIAGEDKYLDARKRRKRVANGLTDMQIAKADLFAREWWRKHREAEEAAEAP